MFRKIWCFLLATVLLAGCIPSTVAVLNSATPPVSAAETETKASIPTATTTLLVPTAVPLKITVWPTKIATVTPAVTSSPVIEQTTALPASTAAVGPDVFPEGINPLTGLPVQNPANLAYPPALVSITNFPVTARPQAGLSFSPFVFEMYIGDGMTRFLAVFYGDFPQQAEGGIALTDDKIGPVRSGRLPYEAIRKMFNGFLVMASASPAVKSNLNAFTNVYGTDTDNINSAMLPVSKLEETASQSPAQLEEGALSGHLFDPRTPADGNPGQMLWIPFNFLNQVIWRYDAASGAYLRYQDNADAVTFIQSTDRLNGEALTYENVVILFANHTAQNKTLIDIDFLYINRMPALLFRNGKMYEIYWTTANEDYEKNTGKLRPMRFIDAQGNPFPLKPGQTWVEIVPAFTRYNETVDSENYFTLKRQQSPGSGVWAIHFSPVLPEP